MRALVCKTFVFSFADGELAWARRCDPEQSRKAYANSVFMKLSARMQLLLAHLREVRRVQRRTKYGGAILHERNLSRHHPTHRFRILTDASAARRTLGHGRDPRGISLDFVAPNPR